MASLTQLAARALVKDRIKYFEELSDKQAPTIKLDKISVSLQDMWDEKLKRARVSKYKKQSSFQNLFHERLEQMPGKRERAQITTNAVIEHTIGNRTEFIDKTYGPFKMEVPKLSKPDMYKSLMYTLLQNSFTVLSTETIAKIGATITTHNEQFFKDHIAGALKLNTFLLDKQFQIKQRGDNTCMVDFVWHNCKGKKGFPKYTYQKLYNEMEVYGSASFPTMSTQEHYRNICIFMIDIFEWAQVKNDVNLVSIKKSPGYIPFLVIVPAQTSATFAYSSMKNRTSRD